MKDLEKDLANLKEKSEQARQAYLRAEMRAEHALKERDEAMKALEDEHNLRSLEEAKARLSALKEDLEAKVKEAEKKLGEVV